MTRIALYTFGILKGAYQSEALTEFAGMARMIFPTLGGADGFIAQAGDARPDLLGRAGHGEDFGAWGVYVAPRFFDARWQASGASMVQTLSLWRDCEAARRFAYNGLHRDALKRRSAWFQPPQWPGYVLWWVPEDVVPTWSDGVRRLEILADAGPTASGFSFARRYDESGRPELAKQVAAH
jgi:hypothetical protein